jgi:hypothetical protein
MGYSTVPELELWAVTGARAGNNVKNIPSTPGFLINQNAEEAFSSLQGHKPQLLWVGVRHLRIQGPDWTGLAATNPPWLICRDAELQTGLSSPSHLHHENK